MRYIKIRRFGREISPRPHFLVGYDSAFEPGPMPTQLLRPRVRGPRHALNVLQRHTLLKPLVVNTCELPILLALAHQAHTKVREAKTPGRSGCRGRRRGCGCGRPRGRGQGRGWRPRGRRAQRRTSVAGQVLARPKPLRTHRLRARSGRRVHARARPATAVPSPCIAAMPCQRDWQPRIINARTLCARGRQKGWCKPENMCKHQILRSKSQHQILRSKSQEYRIDRCSSRCEPDFALVLCSARWLPPVSFSRCLTLAALLHTTPCAVRTTGA